MRQPHIDQTSRSETGSARPEQFAPRVFRYVVVHNGGFAPCFDHGICTLACCKPAIRRTAKVGEWVLGFAPRRQGEARLLYAMRVAQVIGFASYAVDPTFADRTDNIWQPDGRGGFRHAGSHDLHRTDEARKRDLSGVNVLIADRFWDFGPHGLDLNAAVGSDIARRLWFSGRGHKVSGLVAGDLEALTSAIGGRGSRVGKRAAKRRSQDSAGHC
jgi:hypothetical protein